MKRIAAALLWAIAAGVLWLVGYIASCVYEYFNPRYPMRKP